LGGLLLSGAVAIAAGPPAPPLADQLVSLGKQARSAGKTADAARFFAEAIRRDPKNADAQRLLKLVRQDPNSKPLDSPDRPTDTPANPGDPPPAPLPAGDVPPPAGNATIERASQLERVHQQEVTSAVQERIETARGELNRGNPEAAINLLRLGLTALNSDDQIPEATKRALAARLSAQIQAATHR